MDPEKLIKALRQTDEYIEDIFMHGSCYRFHLFLKNIYPESKPFIYETKSHIITKIGSSFYDIREPLEEKFIVLYDPLEEEDMEMVEKWSFRKKNLLKLTDCPVCEEPLCFK